jgi:hypothetical protein
MPIVRAIRDKLPVCLLLNQPSSGEVVDSTVYAAWLSGFDLVLTLGQAQAVFERWFEKLRENMGEE